MTACDSKKSTDTENIEIENKEVPPEERAEKELYDEVMDIHDAIMPEMDNIMKLKGELQEKYDIGKDQNSLSEDELKTYESAIQELEKADDVMMDWMHKFEPQDDNPDHDAVMDYYKNEKEKISDVKEQMQNAMTNAKTVLGQ
ncbi:hypothetical protein [Fulvivirga ligni]|uniref:hypothetical protein n=1 Tax=Fulvivirga ligni TaxID=2904246 RepID=UPI001F48B2EB|nr:hypothetical protein [Fulvivirga ligni]UII21104.1 hypothetical protein LVD16_25025 [Fulvivirga ligni]